MKPKGRATEEPTLCSNEEDEAEGAHDGGTNKNEEEIRSRGRRTGRRQSTTRRRKEVTHTNESLFL